MTPVARSPKPTSVTNATPPSYKKASSSSSSSSSTRSSSSNVRDRKDDFEEDDDSPDEGLSALPGSWRFSQCFGDKSDPVEVAEGDLISAVSFDRSGRYLASGDRAGRVVLFESAPASGSAAVNGPEYRFYTEFQSHESEFDYLKSLEINERINKIEWWSTPPQQDALFLLSTNDKTVKLWKVRERQVQMVLENVPYDGRRSLSLPRTARSGETVVAAAPRRVYSNAHAYHIHSISANCDGETFLSADDLRVNLWHVEHPGESHCVLDIKPATIEDLTEVITATKFHPSRCNLLAFSSSKGHVRMADLRDAAVIDGKYARTFSSAPSATNDFFGEIVSSISDVAFAEGQEHLIAARDFLTVKLWDVRNEQEPLTVLPVHDDIRPKLCDLYEDDTIFDKFSLALSRDGSFAVTGSYGNRVRVLPCCTPAEDAYVETLTADKTILASSLLPNNGSSNSAKATLMQRGAIGRRTRLWRQGSSDSLSFERRILQSALSPRGDAIAIAAAANLFVFTESRGSSTSSNNR